MGSKRTFYDIIHDVLQSCKNGSRKTRLMYSANLSYYLTIKYVSFLENARLIARKDDMYFLTEKGRTLLEKLNKYRNMRAELEKILKEIGDAIRDK
jgi:predicted transcriptional regulator